MKIKNVIFDLGGVIMTINQSRAIQRFKEIGVKDVENWVNQYTQGGIFGELEEGKISADDFCKVLSDMAGRKLSYEDCCYAWQGYMEDVPKRNLKTLKQLKRQGYHLVLLSNTNPFMMELVESERFDGEGHPLSYYFDAEYKSYEVKALKPSEAFFNKVLSEENMKPSECLFVDDGARNCAAASELGINTMLAVNGADWTESIYKLLD